MVNWLEVEAKRAAHNLLTVNGVLLAILMFAALTEHRYLKNFVMGCRAISIEELNDLQSPTQTPRNFVTITGSSAAVPTGYQDIEQELDKYTNKVLSTKVKADYMALAVGDRILLVKAPGSEARAEFSGELVPVPADLDSALRNELASHPDVQARLLPFALNATDYRENGYWAFGIGIPLVALFAWNCYKAMRRISEPQFSPVWKQAAIYDDPYRIAVQIGGEQAMGVSYGKVTVMPSWIAHRGIFNTWISPVSDLVWAYKKITKHYHNFIPTGKSYTAILVGGHKQRIEVQMKEKLVDALLQDLANRAQWAVFGFTAEIDGLWKRDPAGFTAHVQSRRDGKAVAPAAPAAPAPVEATPEAVGVGR